MADPARHCGPKNLDTDPEFFFSTEDAVQAVAKRTCHRCPVQSACVQYALNIGERHGVWAAT